MSPSQIVIRPCIPTDLPGVQRLMRQLAEFARPTADLDLETMAQLLARMEQAPAVYANLVAEAEGQVAGFISLVFYRTMFHRGGSALINELVVDEKMRGRGIGRALINAACCEAKSRGMDEIEVGTECHNIAAQEFYRRCGFNEEYVLLGMEFED